MVKWDHSIATWKRQMIQHIRHHVAKTAGCKRWRKRNFKRALSLKLADKSTDDLLIAFDALFVRLIRPPRHMVANTEAELVYDRPSHFYD